MGQELRLIVDRVRAEAKIKGHGTLSGLIIYTLNEVLREYTARRRFAQLYVVSEPIAQTAGGTFPIPEDLQHLQKDYFYFSENGDLASNSYGLYYGGDFRGNTAGLPQRIQRIGNNLLVYPYDDITASGRIYINYWRYPLEMTAPTQEFELEEIQATVVKETIARISRQGDFDVLALYIKEAARSYSASYGVDAQR